MGDRDIEKRRNSISRETKKNKENGKSDNQRKYIELHKDDISKEDSVNDRESETEGTNEEDDIWQTFDPSQVPKRSHNLEKERMNHENGSFRKRQENLNGSIRKDYNQNNGYNKNSQDYLNGSFRLDNSHHRKSQESLG